MGNILEVICESMVFLEVKCSFRVWACSLLVVISLYSFEIDLVHDGFYVLSRQFEWMLDSI